MEISEEVYSGFGWSEKTVIWDETRDIFNPEPIFDVLGSFAEETCKIISDSERRFGLKILFAQQSSSIWRRYDNQTRKTDYWFPRIEHTPKQKRRIRKQTNKYRKRLLGE